MVHKDPESKCGTGSRLTDTYDIVDDPSSDSIISWSENGKSFIVWKPEEFARDYLPKLLLSDDFSAFTRMLHRFGFRKIGSERWEFADDDFVRGKPKLVHNKINRKRFEGRIALKIVESEKEEFGRCIRVGSGSVVSGSVAKVAGSYNGNRESVGNFGESFECNIGSFVFADLNKLLVL